MSLTEKTDTRDSDEKVVEFLPDCNKFLHMILRDRFKFCVNVKN